MLISIAFKNMLRYKRRTLVTSCAVAFGVMFSIVFNGFLTGMNNESIRNLIDYETSGAKFFAGFLTAFIACLIPSRMALKVQPAEALRAEN